MGNIDVINAKILKMLLKDSRTSFTEMAKTCKISVGAARMRYNRLKEEGVINGEFMHINPDFWGYEYVTDIRVNTSLGNEEAVAKMLNNKRCSTSMCIFGVGKFGEILMGLVGLAKLDLIRRIVEEVEATPKVSRVETLIWTKSQDIYHPENLIIKPITGLFENKVEPKTAPSKNEEVHIDEADKQIVRLLIENSRRSFSGVAKEIGISTHKVITRYNKLREGKVITRSAISVDLNKLGYKAIIYYFLKLESKSRISQIRQQLLKIRNVIVLIEHSGIYDIRVEIPVGDIKDIFLANEQIHAINGIEKVDYGINRCPKLFPWPLYTKIVSSEATTH